MKPLLLTAGLAAVTVQAATVTTSMPVQIIIQNACAITIAPTLLDFGAVGVLSANFDNASTMSVTCTTAAPYNIGLGGGASTNVAARTMTAGGNFVGYELYQDTARTLLWGDTVGTDTLAGTGNGSAQVVTVYGRVPPQATPLAGTYLDTVAVTVTY